MTDMSKVTSIKLKFIGLYLISLILIGVVIFAFGEPRIFPPHVSASITKDKHSEEDEVVIADKLLHTQLNELYDLDKQYNAVKGNTNSNAIRTINEKVNRAEQALEKSIDSLEQVKATFKSTNSASAITSITSSFKNVLIAYKNYKGTRSNTNSNSPNGSNKEIIMQLTADVKKRDERIKELEDLSKASTQSKVIKTSPDIKKMEQENHFLSSALSDMVNKNERLTQTNNLQRQNIEKLNKQIEAFRKFVDKQ